MRTCHSASPARRRRPIQPCSGNGECSCARIETLGRKRRGSIVESGAARAIVAIDCTVTSSNGARSTNGLSGRAMNSKNSGGIFERSGVTSPAARANIAATSALASSRVPRGGLGAGAPSHGHSVTSRPRNALRRLLASGSSAAKTSPVGSSISGTPPASAAGRPVQPISAATHFPVMKSPRASSRTAQTRSPAIPAPVNSAARTLSPSMLLTGYLWISSTTPSVVMSHSPAPPSGLGRPGAVVECASHAENLPRGQITSETYDA